jgi:uncharacterized protein
LILRWRDVQDEASGVQLQETQEFPDLVKENRQVIAMSPIVANLHAIESSGMLTVSGSLLSKATYRCSRCLTDFQTELLVPFQEVFVKRKNDVSEEDKLGQIPVGDVFSLDSYIEQAIQLEVPYSPHCQEECAGLCPVCGINRNLQNCECNTERIDPRLADLANFFEQE